MCLGRPQAHARPHHGVERVGDADDESAGRVFLDAGADLLHHLEVDAQKIDTAHAGLAWHAGGDDADGGAVDGVVQVVPVIWASKPSTGEDWTRSSALPLGMPSAMSNMLTSPSSRPMRWAQRAADLAGADQCNLGTRHVGNGPSPCGTAERPCRVGAARQRRSSHCSDVALRTERLLLWSRCSTLTSPRSPRPPRSRSGRAGRGAAPDRRPSASRSGARRCSLNSCASKLCASKSSFTRNSPSRTGRGRGDQLDGVVVERVDQDDEALGLVAAAMVHRRDAVEHHRVKLARDLQIVAGGQRARRDRETKTAPLP